MKYLRFDFEKNFVLESLFHDKPFMPMYDGSIEMRRGNRGDGSHK